jgi:hypothetical protein
MEMPGSAPGVWKERWQYCPMRTRRLCGLTLVVLALHLIAWQIVLGGLSRHEAARAGVHRLALVSVPQGARVPSTPVADVGAHLRTLATAALSHRLEAPTSGRPHAASARAHAHTGDGGAQQSTKADTPEWPVYATHAPPSATLHYALVQEGAASASSAGSAALEWSNSANAFSLRLATTLFDRPPREWQSTGTFDAAGVAPLRLVERERGRDKRAINFDRDGGRVRFSGASGALAIAPGAQDRWSWIAQLAAIAEADAQRDRRAVAWDLQVAGLRGELERWTFQVLPPGELPPELQLQGNELSAAGDRAPALLHVLRAAERPYDLRIEAWLSPSLHHLPAGLRMSTPPGPWSLALWQRSS